MHSCKFSHDSQRILICLLSFSCDLVALEFITEKVVNTKLALTCWILNGLPQSQSILTWKHHWYNIIIDQGKKEGFSVLQIFRLVVKSLFWLSVTMPAQIVCAIITSPLTDYSHSPPCMLWSAAHFLTVISSHSCAVIAILPMCCHLQPALHATIASPLWWLQ